MRGGKLVNVEAGRGVAAMLVVLFHVSKYYFATPKYWNGSAVGGLFLFGHAGVEFFFVLSGFIMVWVHRQDVGQPKRVGAFAWKRFQRIYPFFWIVLAVTVLIAWRIPTLGQSFYRDPAVILQSAALVGQDPMHAVVFVSWTLWHEMVFYAFCALVIAWPRLGVPAFLVWMLACASQALPTYVFEFINILFGMGVMTALALQRWTIPRPGVFVAVGIVLFFGTGLVVDYTDLLPEWTTRFLFGLGSALGLAGAVELERSRGLSAPGVMRVLGAASYSIYLTHILTLTFLAKSAVALHLTRILPPLVAFVGLAAGAILVGIAVHYTIERRVLAATAALRTMVLSLRAPAAAKAQSRA